MGLLKRLMQCLVAVALALLFGMPLGLPSMMTVASDAGPPLLLPFCQTIGLSADLCLEYVNSNFYLPLDDGDAQGCSPAAAPLRV